MEILATVLAILKVLDMTFKVHDRVVQAEQRPVISDTLQKISVLLDIVANDLEAGIYPHGRCAELAEYLNNIDRLLEGKLRDTDVQRFKEYLRDAVQIEQLSGQMNSCDPTVKAYNINMLRSASGSYNALSVLIKV